MHAIIDMQSGEGCYERDDVVIIVPGRDELVIFNWKGVMQF